MGGYKKTAPMVYVVSWPQSKVVKVGFTAKQRYRHFVINGAELNVRYEFEDAHSAFEFETFGHDWLRVNSAGYAFETLDSSKPFMGPDGGGYAECFSADMATIDSLLEHMLEHAAEHAAKQC